MDMPQRTDEIFEQNLAALSREKKEKVVNFFLLIKVQMYFDTILVIINVTTNGSSRRVLTH